MTRCMLLLIFPTKQQQKTEKEAAAAAATAPTPPPRPTPTPTQPSRLHRLLVPIFAFMTLSLSTAFALACPIALWTSIDAWGLALS